MDKYIKYEHNTKNDDNISILGDTTLHITDNNYTNIEIQMNINVLYSYLCNKS